MQSGRAQCRLSLFLVRRCCHVLEAPTALCGSTTTQLGSLHLHLKQSHSLQGNGKPCVGALLQTLESSSSAALPLLLLEEGAFQVGATSHSGGPKSQLTVVMATSLSEGVGAAGSKGCPSLLRNNAPGSLLSSLG